MAAFGIYALPQGIPVGMINVGVGVGGTLNPPPTQDSFHVFIASDTEGKFGHRCPMCKGYWRSTAVPFNWQITCPYCGTRADTHNFLTEGQTKYVRACCDLIIQAMQSEADGEHVIDMDEVADAVGKEVKKPDFYYAEESQQNQFDCQSCGAFNDILGRYGYCSCCGTHNGLKELQKDIDRIRERLKTVTDYENSAKDAVAGFDSFARQLAKQFADRIPMTPTRQKEWDKKLFHNLKPCVEALGSVFGINLFKGLQENEINFATLMFHRRHVYEHNGGEADQKYIDDSGDVAVKPKQVLHETKETAFRIQNIILAMARNFHTGFHLIFPPEEKAIKALSHYKKT